MSIALMIRDLRQSQNLSQGELAKRLEEASGVAIGREKVSRWERPQDGVIPREFWLRHLARILDTPYEALEREATVSRMNRRGFMRLAALTTAHGGLAREMVASIAGSDSGPLTTMQTTHGTDLVIAALADKACQSRLRRWMHDGSDAVLRVNAAGILAKAPGQEPASDVCRVLVGDANTRHLYMTAVASRVCAMDWRAAGQLASDPLSFPERASFLAARFADEVTNPRDAGARWCSAVMLRDLSPLLGRS